MSDFSGPKSQAAPFLASKLVAALLAENASLRAEVAELQRRLGQNSTNSSKPPRPIAERHLPPGRRVGTGVQAGRPAATADQSALSAGCHRQPVSPQRPAGCHG